MLGFFLKKRTKHGFGIRNNYLTFGLKIVVIDIRTSNTYIDVFLVKNYVDDYEKICDHYYPYITNLFAFF